MPAISSPTYVFAPNTTILSARVNANFQQTVDEVNASAVFRDVAASITVMHTLTAGLRLANTQALVGRNVAGNANVDLIKLTAADAVVVGAFTLPAADGTAGQFMKTDGAGVLAFTSVAPKATILETARTINGVNFDGSGNITVTASGATLSGTSLASGIVSSSLTSVGTLTGLNVANGAGVIAIRNNANSGFIPVLGMSGSGDVVRLGGTTGAIYNSAIDFYANNAARVRVTDTEMAPTTTNELDFGLTGQRWKAGWFQGTVTSATGFAGVGTSLTALNATNLGSGTVPIARLGTSGTPSSTTFLRGDNVWATPAGGGGGGGVGGGGTPGNFALWDVSGVDLLDGPITFDGSSLTTLTSASVVLSGNGSVSGTLMVSGAITAGTSLLLGSSYLESGANAPGSGTFRLARATTFVFRNNGNSANITALSVTSGDVVTIGGAIGGAVVAVAGFSMPTADGTSGQLVKTNASGALSFTSVAPQATILATARTINGTSFDGSGNITVTAAAGTLTGGTLNSGVTASSLTSVGTLSALTLGGTLAMAGNSITTALMRGYSQYKSAPSISSNTLTLDYTAGPDYVVALNANISTMTITNWPSPGVMGKINIYFVADGTGRTIAYDSAFKWDGGAAPTPPSINGYIHAVTLLSYDGKSTGIGLLTAQACH